MYVLKRSTMPVVSFFDCDDYMHPQRMEILHAAFSNNPDLEYLLHTYTWIRRSEFTTSVMRKYDRRIFTPDSYTRWKPPWNYTFFHKQQIFQNWNGREWDPEDKESEPPNYSLNQKIHYWFPYNSSLTPYTRLPVQNAWGTGRRSLYSVIPYPNYPLGTDSLFNWRVIHNQRNFSVLPMDIAYYLWNHSRPCC